MSFHSLSEPINEAEWGLTVYYKMMYLQMRTFCKIISTFSVTIIYETKNLFLFTSNICANWVSLLENIAWIQWIAYLAWRGGPFLDLWCKTGSKALKKREKQKIRKINMTSTRYLYCLLRLIFNRVSFCFISIYTKNIIQMCFPFTRISTQEEGDPRQPSSLTLTAVTPAALPPPTRDPPTRDPPTRDPPTRDCCEGTERPSARSFFVSSVTWPRATRVKGHRIP